MELVADDTALEVLRAGPERVSLLGRELELAQIARAIERADRAIGAGRVRYIHPDCGFWMLKRPIADAKIRALTAGRNLYEGRTR